ncbi:hypothetical protein [Solidesulfovibrio carbinoliphilus]|nr:hypothetical protein [Solidesulfovibrio carbinoliphilus]
MKTLLELAADTQAALDTVKNKCSPKDHENCRRCWDLETELERLMRLYHECTGTN